jgi:hypothetical protein
MKHENLRSGVGGFDASTETPSIQEREKRRAAGSRRVTPFLLRFYKKGTYSPL